MIEASIVLKMENNQFINIRENKKHVFTYKDIFVYLKGNNTFIDNSNVITFYTSQIPNNKESLENIKQIFNNIFIELIRKSASVSYEVGNFARYDNDCLEIYKIIKIREIENDFKMNLTGNIVSHSRGYELEFKNIHEYDFNAEISDAILLKLYSNLIFWNKNIPNYMHNSINRACLEKLISNEEYKEDEILEIIDMAILFIKERYMDNKYIDEVVRSFENIRKKSKNQRVVELMERNIRDEKKYKEYKKIIKKNQINRGYESHEFTKESIEPIWIDNIFYEIIRSISIVDKSK